MKQQKYNNNYRARRLSRTSNMSRPAPINTVEQQISSPKNQSLSDNGKESIYYYGSKNVRSNIYNGWILGFLIAIPIFVLFVMSINPIGGIVAAIIGILILSTYFVLWLFDINLMERITARMIEFRSELNLWRERKI